jgi:hypothetical protein
VKIAKIQPVRTDYCDWARKNADSHAMYCPTSSTGNEQDPNRMKLPEFVELMAQIYMRDPSSTHIFALFP